MQEKTYLLSKRLFDIVVSLVLMICLSPLFLVISIMIIADSKGSIFYRQKRVGKNYQEFNMLKFRTMKPGSDRNGLLTIGDDDSRITRTGKILRRYKLDELPQLINVFTGTMSIVGPRPEVKKYVDLYNEEQKKVLSIKPGITDPVSIEFFNENEILFRYADPEEGYVKEIMPEKLRLNLEYLRNRNFFSDLMIIIKTLRRIFLKKKPTRISSKESQFVQ